MSIARRYKIVEGRDTEHLAELVEIEIVGGWQPQGGVAATCWDGVEPIFHQAMIHPVREIIDPSTQFSDDDD